jgi:magnesium-protoporphyrin IX monomethyl ester (oxidative) cyclase
MYVRDHTRPELHKALGLDPTEYDFEVFRVTTAISRQVFPFTLDIDHPRFLAGLDRLRQIGEASAAAKRAGGVRGQLRRLALGASGAVTLLRMYLIPTKPNALPQDVRLAPAW